ncbi:hypothetical protein SRHO_G00266100 [Serrasalmus rhombeus]
MSKMFLSVPVVLLILTGVNECHFLQKLKCPYTPEQKGQQRVWCKRDSDNHECCSGIAFQAGETQVMEGKLTVQDDGQSFVVSVNSLPQGDGVYWCGLKNSSNVIVKLAESQLYSTPPGFVWGILRWIVFLLLLLAVISTCICSKRKTRSEEKKNQLYESVLEEKQR